VISLAEVLALDEVQRARPELVVGEHLLDRQVRWVHTSELAEAASLLKGGELLLTTGLGLAGRGPVAQQIYIAELAARKVSALALELGWTFATVPEPLVAAARRCELPLVALHEIVPFVELTEAVQSRLLRANYAKLQLDQDIDQMLHAELLKGQGPQALVTVLAEFLHQPVLLEAAAGQVVAFAALPPEISPRSALKRSRIDSAPIEVLGNFWGRLHFLGLSAEPPSIVKAVKERAPSAIALSLLWDQQSLSLRSRLSQSFVQELLSGRIGSRGDLIRRATLVNFSAPADGAFIGFAVGGYPAEESSLALRAAEASVREHLSLVVELDGLALGLLEASRVRDAQEWAEQLVRSITSGMARSGSQSQPRVAVGPAVAGLEAAGLTLREAHAALLLAEELDLNDRAVTTRGLAADRILSQMMDEPLLGLVVEGQIGPLVLHDLDHRGYLTETLWTYLTHASAKSDAAKVLHVRRQTLYKRLAKIKEIIGNVDDPQRRLSLLMALRAHQLMSRRGRWWISETAMVAGAASPCPPDPRSDRRPAGKRKLCRARHGQATGHSRPRGGRRPTLSPPRPPVRSRPVRTPGG
jgi:purine catabolism regulator